MTDLLEPGGKLWLLRPVGEKAWLDSHPAGQKWPWRPWYDKNFGYVIRARDEATARRMATESAGDEDPGVWRDPTDSVCIELSPDGAEEIVITDNAAA